MKIPHYAVAACLLMFGSDEHHWSSFIAPAHAVEYTVTHTFSVGDILGGFDGRTFAEDPTIVCNVPGFTANGLSNPGNVGTVSCPPEVQPFPNKEGVVLYPIDSEFGWHGVDFVGAVARTRDNNYLEGYAGNVEEGGQVIGLSVANTGTTFYKVPPPLGTWCHGLGSNAVKCSTEHYSVMENLLTCHETNPYKNEDETNQCPQSIMTLDKGEEGVTTLDCATKQLDNNLFVVKNGVVSDTPYTGNIAPNDNTDALNNMAVGKATADYSITLKDDGKVLYRFGNLIKRPTDIRMYAKMALPDEWKTPTENIEGINVTQNFVVNKAYLEIDHWITNNPNDQIRPEDLENEGATGRKPDYQIDDQGRWRSINTCYEGNGALLEAGTILKQSDTTCAAPFELSADLKPGSRFTNAWYTTIDRDPFAWSYQKTDPVLVNSSAFEFVGKDRPLTAEEEHIEGLELVSGPRWRLKPNKFGQDIPGLEVPTTGCESPPPFEHGNVKYEVGQRTTTIINLLDWNEEKEGKPSPLSTSAGWTDVATNEFVSTDAQGLSTNGIRMSDDFDLAVYIKGDKKPTTIYSAKLSIDYGPPNSGKDLEQNHDYAVSILEVDPPTPTYDSAFCIHFDIRNVGTTTPLAGTESFHYEYTDDPASQPFQATVHSIPSWEAGAIYEPYHFCTIAPPVDSDSVGVFKVWVDSDDINPDNNVDEITVNFQNPPADPPATDPPATDPPLEDPRGGGADPRVPDGTRSLTGGVRGSKKQ